MKFDQEASRPDQIKSESVRPDRIDPTQANASQRALIEPRYFVAVFGDPGNPPEKDLVESGRYISGPKICPVPAAAGRTGC